MADYMSKEPENRKENSKRNRAVEIDGDGSEFSSNTDVTDYDDGEVVLESTTVKKRKRKRKRAGPNHEEGDEFGVFGARDPLIVFGQDIMMMILSYLDARSVALSLLVSRGWHGVASRDALWSPKCEELWLGKAHIPRLSQVKGLSKLAAYLLSVMDGKRTRIMKEDLWDHVWEFRFNKGKVIWPVYRTNGEAQEKAIKESVEMLKTIEEDALAGFGFLGEKKFFGGHQIGVVDIAFGSIACWLGSVEKVGGVKLLEEHSFPRLLAWVKNFKDVPVIKDNLPDHEYLVAYLKRRKETFLLKA